MVDFQINFVLLFSNVKKQITEGTGFHITTLKNSNIVQSSLQINIESEKLFHFFKYVFSNEYVLTYFTIITI